MKILAEKIKKLELLDSDVVFDGPMVKAVVDVKKEVVAIDAELHADMEQLLLENGSRQDDLWGINFYPEETEEDFIEFDSMINVRPRQGNRSRDVEDPAVRKKIISVVEKWME